MGTTTAVSAKLTWNGVPAKKHGDSFADATRNTAFSVEFKQCSFSLKSL